MDKEQLLAIWMGTEPTARSPYNLYGNPPMWETVTVGNRVLFTRPGRVMVRPAPLAPYQETDGVHYQWQKDGKWFDQGRQTTFEHFMKMFAEEFQKNSAAA